MAKSTIACRPSLRPATTCAGRAMSLTHMIWMQSYPAEPMRIWPISTRVNKPDNDDPSILEPIELILV